MERALPGCAVSVWCDGIAATNNCALCQCDHIDTQWKCPFAMGYVSPMEEGDRCHFKDGGNCMSLRAKLDGMKRALALAKREIKKIEEEMEG